MRELVYLSERKLRMFLPERPPWWRRFRLGSIKLEGLGASVEASSNDLASTEDLASRLTAAIRHIESNAKWCFDPSVQTGDWVHFDAKFNICEVASLFEGTVFFPDFADSRYRNTGETAGPPDRLVLHGAIKHLVGSAREHISDEVLRVQSASEWPTRLLMYGPAIDLSSRINRMQHFSPLSPDMPMVFDRSGFPPDFPALLYAGPIGGLRMLVKQLDKTLPPSTYSSMAGYARVTAMDKAASNQPRIIAATPLFVERVSGTRSSVTW